MKEDLVEDHVGRVGEGEDEGEESETEQVAGPGRRHFLRFFDGHKSHLSSNHHCAKRGGGHFRKQLMITL